MSNDFFAILINLTLAASLFGIVLGFLIYVFIKLFR